MTLAMGNLLRVAATVLPFLATFNRQVGWRKRVSQRKGLQTIHTETVSDWFSQDKIKVSRMTWDYSPIVAIEELPTRHAFSSPTSPTRPEKTLVIARKKREVQSRIELREGRLLLAEPKRLSRHKRIHQKVKASKFWEEKNTNKNKTVVRDVINCLEELIWGDFGGCCFSTFFDTWRVMNYTIIAIKCKPISFQKTHHNHYKCWSSLTVFLSDFKSAIHLSP